MISKSLGDTRDTKSDVKRMEVQVFNCSSRHNIENML